MSPVQGAKELRPHVFYSETPRFIREKPGVPYESVRLHGRLLNFADMRPLYGTAFTGRLLDAITVRYLHANGNTTASRVSRLRKFMVYVAAVAAEPANAKTPIARVFEGLVHDHPITLVDMKDTVGLFCLALRDLSNLTIVNTTNPITRQMILESVSATLGDLAAEGMWPDVGPLRGLRRGRKFTSVPSLGELRREEDQPVSRESYSEILSRSRQRMLRLRKLMEDVLLEEQAMVEKGKALLARVEPPLTLIEETIQQMSDPFQRQRGLSWQERRCFPPDDAQARLSSVLRYATHHFGHAFRLHDLPWKLQRIVATVGGINIVQRHLEGRVRGAMAAWAIIAIDSGLNVQPLDDLSVNPFIGEARRGQIRIGIIGSIKNRAGYAPVEGHLAEVDEPGTEEAAPLPLKVEGSRISGVEAIRIWQSISAPTRASAKRGSPEAGLLWVVRRGDEPVFVRKIGASQWKYAWNDFLAEHRSDPIIGGLAIQRRMLRVTFIHLRDLENNGDARFLAKIAQHQRARITVGHYVNRAYMRRRLDQLVAEYQHVFEAAIVPDTPKRGTQLEVGNEVMAQRRAAAMETGLGFLCADPLAGIQPGQEGKLCTKLDACSSCQLLRFAPTREAIRALILFRRSLERAQEEFFNRNPERWIEVWVPALALCIAAWELLSVSSCDKCQRRPL